MANTDEEPKPRARQKQLPTLERKVDREIAAAAEAYVTERDKRMELSKREKDTKTALIALMRKKGIEVYRDSEASPPVVITVSSKDSVKVTEVPDEVDPEEEG